MICHDDSGVAMVMSSSMTKVTRVLRIHQNSKDCGKRAPEAVRFIDTMSLSYSVINSKLLSSTQINYF